MLSVSGRVESSGDLHHNLESGRSRKEMYSWVESMKQHSTKISQTRRVRKPSKSLLHLKSHTAMSARHDIQNSAAEMG